MGMPPSTLGAHPPYQDLLLHLAEALFTQAGHSMTGLDSRPHPCLGSCATFRIS